MIRGWQGRRGEQPTEGVGAPLAGGQVLAGSGVWDLGTKGKVRGGSHFLSTGQALISRAPVDPPKEQQKDHSKKTATRELSLWGKTPAYC